MGTNGLKLAESDLNSYLQLTRFPSVSCAQFVFYALPFHFFSLVLLLSHLEVLPMILFLVLLIPPHVQTQGPLND